MKQQNNFTCPIVRECLSTNIKESDLIEKYISLFNKFFEFSMLDAERDFYKKITPVIYRAMNSQENCQEIYTTLYYDSILPCLNAISKGEYCFAYKKYKETILELENNYCHNGIARSITRS